MAPPPDGGWLVRVSAVGLAHRIWHRNQTFHLSSRFRMDGPRRLFHQSTWTHSIERYTCLCSCVSTQLVLCLLYVLLLPNSLVFIAGNEASTQRGDDHHCERRRWCSWRHFRMLPTGNQLYTMNHHHLSSINHLTS